MVRSLPKDWLCTMRQTKRAMRVLLGSLIFLGAKVSVARAAEDEEMPVLARSTQRAGGHTHDDAESTNGPRKIISLAESMKISQRSFQDPQVTELRKQYWDKAFAEIRNLSAFTTTGASMQPTNNHDVFSEWKRFLDDYSYSDYNAFDRVAVGEKEATNGNVNITSNDVSDSSTRYYGPSVHPTMRRYEGFPSWDRVLQDWADEVQEYLDQVKAESAGADYSFSNFGRPSSTSKTPETEAEPAHTDVTAALNKKPLNTTAYPLANSGRVAVADVSEALASAAPPPAAKQRTVVPRQAAPGEAIVPHTDIRDKSKRILIVTTAAMPWRTGTAVNPLLRAAYLTRGRKEAGGSAILMIPWLEKHSDQVKVYGANNTFETPEQQETYIRDWLRNDANMPDAADALDIRWYTAWQNPIENSVYSMGDITALIPAEDVDICILEEPEHLNWYRAPGESWTKKFKHVVGILHTNYFQYALDQPAALIRAPAMRLLCSWMCRAHAHRIIKLSGTLERVAPEKELVENVHGVRGTFLDLGRDLSVKLRDGSDQSVLDVFGPNAEPKVYFIGKLLWSKGLGSLMELLRYAEESANLKVKVEMYGGGPDKEAAEAKAASLELEMPFHGPVDHAELASTQKIFINPSTSEVLCTTVSESLAMGKFVILPSHPSNDFFAQFPNCLTFATHEEFVGCLYYAMTHAPEPLSDESLYALSWEAATERLEAAACIPVAEAEAMSEMISSRDASIEITLPPLVENEEGRRAVATTLRYTRHRYRQFRTKLSNELRQSRVLPAKFRDQLIQELDSRLDLDLDALLESPKLRVKLSPAELDMSLLKLYDSISQSPGGDVLRALGGGGPVALQNLYLKRQSARQRKRPNMFPELFPTFVESDMSKEDYYSSSRRIRQALERTLPHSQWDAWASSPAQESSTSDETAGPTMSISKPRLSSRLYAMPAWNGLVPAKRAFAPPTARRSHTFSVLI